MDIDALKFEEPDFDDNRNLLRVGYFDGSCEGTVLIDLYDDPYKPYYSFGSALPPIDDAEAFGDKLYDFLKAEMGNGWYQYHIGNA